MVTYRESYFIASDLKTCIERELVHTIGGMPAGFDSCVTAGSITWDNCCPGMLRVAANRQFASDRFPDPVFRPGPCGQYSRATDLTALILRCAPGPDQDGNPPSCEKLDNMAVIVSEDMDALWRATRCCFSDSGFDYVIREITAVGPRGQCIGSQMTLTIGLTDWCECHG